VAAAALGGMAMVLALTACGGTGGGKDTGAAGSGAGGGSAPKTTAPAKPAPGTATAAPASAAPAKPAASTAPAAKPTAKATPAATASCDHKMPISPDEIAVYRWTPEGGALSLIVKHGNWGCGEPDTDGAPFVTVGKETYIPLDQAAYVTATNPIVESTENQRIGVQELLDWLEAHPNSGLVFRYELGKDGAIHTLEEVFTP
jgi:hypothetical protein